MKRRDFALSILSPIALAACGGRSDPALAPKVGDAAAASAARSTAARAAVALKHAASYMDEVVSYRGGYAWSY